MQGPLPGRELPPLGLGQAGLPVARFCSWNLIPSMMGSSSWHAQVHFFKSKMKPKSPQLLQSMMKPQSKHKQHDSHSGTKIGSSRKGWHHPGHEVLTEQSLDLCTATFPNACQKEKRKRN